MNLDEEIKRTEQLIQRLHAQGMLNKKVLKHGSVCYRVQGCGYKDAEHYGCPQNPQELGRFNDPRKEIGIWYGAEHPSAALAETFGRLRPKGENGLGIVINSTDLDSRDMCVVEASRDLTLLHLNPCLSKLARTLDEVTGPDYWLTQTIVATVARLPDNPFDGIAFESRHHPDGHSCYALWTGPNEATTINTVAMTKLSKFEYIGKLPEGFDGESIDAEEIITEVLGYLVLGV